MQALTVTLIGTIAGSIWMPPVRCEKEFNNTYSVTEAHKTKKGTHLEWFGLREALLDITNDGDFQSTSLVGEVAMFVELQTDDGILTRTRMITRDNEAVADLFEGEE